MNKIKLSSRLCFILSALIITSMILEACAPTEISTPAATETPIKIMTEAPTASQSGATNTVSVPTLSQAEAVGTVPAELFDIGIRGSDVKAIGGSLWLENHASTNKVYRIDPSNATVTDEFDSGRPCGIAVGLGSVWVADLGSGEYGRSRAGD